MLIDEATELQVSAPVPVRRSAVAPNVCPPGGLLSELIRSNRKTIVFLGMTALFIGGAIVLFPQDARLGAQGISLTRQALDDRLLFISGAILGIAGAFLVAAITVLHLRPVPRTRSRARRRWNSLAPQSQGEPS